MNRANTQQDNIVIKTEKISKHFPGVQALKELDFEVKRGEAHALVGENGAGKSTLMKIIVREYQEDDGDVFIEGQNVKHMRIRDVQQLGLSLIHQDLNLVPMFTVAQTAPSTVYGSRLPVRAGSSGTTARSAQRRMPD